MISIPASSTQSNSGKTVLDLTQCNKRLDFNWINDVYVSDDIDSAIEIESITLKRIGPSERSQLVASLLNAGKGKVPVYAAVAILILSAFGFFILNRRARKY